MSPETKNFENYYPRTTTENKTKGIGRKSSMEIKENT